MAAINKSYKFKLTSYHESLMESQPSMMKLEGIWWSAKPRSLEMTVVTHFSLDRLYMMRNQCRSWRGPISAIAYLPLVQTPEDPASGQGRLNQSNQALVDKAKADCAAMHKELEAANGTMQCQLDLMLFYEVYDSAESKVLYPINNMRNWATLQVRTEVLSQIDIDFVISSSLSDEMSKYGRGNLYRKLCDERKVVVIPAFQTAGYAGADKQLAIRLAGTGKMELLEEFNSGKIIQFAGNIKYLHYPTNYTKWFHTYQMMYKAAYSVAYEPWFITCYSSMPWYDARFRGYGCDKYIAMTMLYYGGYEFLVHPEAWILHVPHPNSAAKDVQLNEAKAHYPPDAMYKQLRKMYDDSAKLMKDHKYKVWLDPRMLQVYQDVPWLPRPPKPAPGSTNFLPSSSSSSSSSKSGSSSSSRSSSKGSMRSDSKRRPTITAAARSAAAQRAAARREAAKRGAL